MSTLVNAQPLPLAQGEDGTIRIGSTRVTLDTVVEAFREGLTAEGIVSQYPTLRLADVYLIIGYVLDHTDEVDAYLRERQSTSDEIRRENEKRFDPAGVRDRLLARKRRG